MTDLAELADPDAYAASDQLDTMLRLQEHEPVYRAAHPAGSFWLLTRYADALQVQQDRVTFSSRSGIQVGQLNQSEHPGADKMLVQADGAQHQRMRAALGSALTPNALRRLLTDLAGTVERVVDDGVDHCRDGGAVDAVADLAQPITEAVIGGLLGVPEQDRSEVFACTRRAFAEHPRSSLDGAQANTELFCYIGELLATQRIRPGRNLIGALTGFNDDSAFSDEQILLNVHLVLAGGYETTRHAIASAVATLVEHPDEWARIRSDPAITDSAVEELLRWTAPSLNVMRTATTDTWIGPVAIRSGERVAVWLPAANRDPRGFERPSVFDPVRTPNRHVSFGWGRHLCLGAWLARTQLRTLVSVLRDRAIGFGQAGTPTRTRSVRVWGYDELPVRLVRNAIS